VSDPLHVHGAIAIPRAELSWRFSRSSGPGGQGVNTADSRVELSWNVAETRALSPAMRERALARLAPRLVDGVLTIVASEHRSQLANRRAAQARLVAALVAAISPPPRTRRPTRPSRGAAEARLTAKRHRSVTKQRRRRPPGEE
jgi:ribosome-associated protein